MGSAALRAASAEAWMDAGCEMGPMLGGGGVERGVVEFGSITPHRLRFMVVLFMRPLSHVLQVSTAESNEQRMRHECPLKDVTWKASDKYYMVKRRK